MGSVDDGARFRFALAEQVGDLNVLYGGRRIISSPLVGEWQMYVFGPSMASADVIVGPLTYWSITHDFKMPMLSMRSRGMRELERDRRRYPR